MLNSIRLQVLSQQKSCFHSFNLLFIPRNSQGRQRRWPRQPDNFSKRNSITKPSIVRPLMKTSTHLSTATLTPSGFTLKIARYARFACELFLRCLDNRSISCPFPLIHYVNFSIVKKTWLSAPIQNTVCLSLFSDCARLGLVRWTRWQFGTSG